MKKKKKQNKIVEYDKQKKRKTIKKNIKLKTCDEAVSIIKASTQIEANIFS